MSDRSAYTAGGPLIGRARGDAPAPGAADARIGVVTFPGTLDDRDAARAVALSGAR